LNGISVDPSKIKFAKLQKNMKCKCFNNAISDKIENVEFVEVLEGYVQMSGINSHNYKKTLQIVNGNIQNKIQNYSTTTITFNDIAQTNKNIDYLSIDIEGSELQVLNSIKFDDYEIKVLSLENNDQKEINFNKLLQYNGFLYFDTIGVDEIFYNKKYYNF
jgi:FkbM family methyltransferase